MTSARLPFLDVCGAWVQPLSRAALLRTILVAAQQRSGAVIGHHNLHSLALVRQDASMRAFYAKCQHVFIDGMPLVWLGRLHGHRLRTIHRHTGVDWLPQLCASLSRTRLRVAYVGSRAGVWEAGFANIRRLHHPTTALEIHGHHGFFDKHHESTDNQTVCRRIAAIRPHLLIVGMGMPIQERWVLENQHRLEAGCILTIGATLDYFAGQIATPPRWAGQMGLEWLFRLADEPRRLTHRYLVEPWPLLPSIVRDLRAYPSLHRGRCAPPLRTYRSAVAGEQATQR